MAKNRTQDRHKPSKMIRIPTSLYDELEALADQNERPVHWEARIAIREHLERAKRGEPTNEHPDDAPAKKTRKKNGH